MLLLRREAVFMTAAAHPSVLRCHGILAGDDPAQPYKGLVMELGVGSLYDAIAQRADRVREGKEPGPLPATHEVARTMVDLAGGLEYLHGKGLIHGDVKPDNCVRGQDGRARLADFGQAQALVPGRRPVSGLGTLMYLSPQRLAGQDPTPEDDVWAYALTLLEVATLRDSFWGRKEAVKRVVSAGEVPDIYIPAELHPRLRTLLAACLQWEPAARPSWKVIIQCLEELVDWPFQRTLSPWLPALVSVDDGISRASTGVARGLDWPVQPLLAPPATAPSSPSQVGGPWPLFLHQECIHARCLAERVCSWCAFARHPFIRHMFRFLAAV